MIMKRAADERGITRLSWLDSRHSFSFGEYYDPRHMGIGVLRVINEDRVVPGGGFGAHGHRDMEIVSYVLEGALEHKDSIGTGSIIRPGEVQRMTAGTGIRHSEFNPSRTEPVHFLQIWILPDRRGLEPDYEQCLIPKEARQGRFAVIAGPEEGNGSAVRIHQDARILAAEVGPDDRLLHELEPGRQAWIQVISGKITAVGEELSAGDGAAITGQPQIEISGGKAGEVLLFDLP